MANRFIECARSGCNLAGINSCSACLKEYYCSAECQKCDWSTHKIMCKLIKRMPDALQPFNDVSSIIKTVDEKKDLKMNLGKERYFRLLQHTATFAEHQLGKRIAGKVRYEKGNGDRIDACNAEIEILFSTYYLLGNKISFNDYGVMKKIDAQRRYLIT